MKENKKENKYGVATVGYGGEQQREVPIESWLYAIYKEGRKISIIKMEDKEGYALTVENHESSNRSVKQQMWLTPESFMGLFASMSLHMSSDGIDFNKMLAESVVNEHIEYNCSENINPNFDN